MNKFFLGITGIVLGVFSAYIIIGKKPAIKLDHGIVKTSVKSNKNSLSSVQVSSLKDEVDCLGKEICNTKENRVGITKEQRNWNISKKLNDLIMSNKVYDISKEYLGKILREEEKSSFISANYILQKQEEYNFAFNEALEIKSELLKDFLYSYSYPVYMDDENIRNLRNELLLKYIGKKNKMQLVHTLDALNQLSFKQEEVIALKDAFCSLKIPKKNEGQTALYYKFNNFLSKYGETKC